MAAVKVLIVLVFFMGARAQAQSASAANPDISLNALITYTAVDSEESGEQSPGFALQEAELRMGSNVDAYFRGELTLAIEKEESETPGEDGEFVVEPEEAFVETMSLPMLTIKAGKFFASWLRHNQFHAHAYPFIDAPQSIEAIFGDHGFNDLGLSVAYLLPLGWYSELTAQAFEGDQEQVFGSESKEDLIGSYQFKNLWDLSSTATIEAIMAYAHGRNLLNQLNHVYGAAVTFKWRPLEQARKTSFSWTTEYTQAEKLIEPEIQILLGRTEALSSWIRYQFDQRWWVQMRSEQVQYLEDRSLDTMVKHSALLAFVPSEFSTIRFQVDQLDTKASASPERIFRLQWNVSMGVHPAHSY